MAAVGSSSRCAAARLHGPLYSRPRNTGWTRLQAQAQVLIPRATQASRQTFAAILQNLCKNVHFVTPDGTQEHPKRLPGDTQEAPRRLPGGAQRAGMVSACSLAHPKAARSGNAYKTCVKMLILRPPMAPRSTPRGSQEAPRGTHEAPKMF